jgi:hypothetical protein
VRDGADFDDAGVINEDVDLAKMLKRLLDGGLNLRGLEQVALKGQDVGFEASELVFRVLELCLIASEKGDFSTACANLLRDLQTETARAAGDQRNFILEIEPRHLKRLER